MTRLLKKCLIAAAGTHLLLVVVLLCSGFVRSRPKPDDTQVLDVIPAKLIDAAFSSGVKNAQPPPPAPPTPPTPQVQQPPPPTPDPPKQIVKPPESVKPPDPVTPPDEKSLEPTPKPPKERTIKISMDKVVKKITPAKDTTAEDERAAREAIKAAQRAQDARLRAVHSAATAIRNNTSTSTTIDMPGDSTVAYASYASVVKSVYTEAWQPPANSDNDEANVKVSVTIANTGRVISAHIIDRSGDAGLDRTIQNTLDRVTDLPPFPDGSSDKERTYIINFNLKAKRMLG